MHGQVRSALLSYELPSDSSPTQELSISTDNEINWLDHLILHLQTRRALIQQKKYPTLSHSQTSFRDSRRNFRVYQRGGWNKQVFIPSIGRRHSFTPIRLGAVCSRWRHVGWNSPWVWSKLSLTGCWILEPRFPLVKILNIYHHNLKLWRSISPLTAFTISIMIWRTGLLTRMYLIQSS